MDDPGPTCLLAACGLRLVASRAAGEEINEAAAGAADKRLDDSHGHQVRSEESVQQTEAVRIQGRAEECTGDELPARRDSQRPLMMVERVHLRREKQRVVVPQLQEVNQPKEECDTGNDEEPETCRLGRRNPWGQSTTGQSPDSLAGG